MSEAETFGITFLGDFATINTMLLLNILSSLPNTPPVVLEVKDCAGQLHKGKKKKRCKVYVRFLS